LEPLPSFRFGNTLLAGLLLVGTAPLMVLIAIAVRLTSRGPVIYRQPRIGLDRRNGGRPSLGDRRGSNLGGRPFSIYKFRTMYHRSGPRGRQVWTRPNDRRVTPVGRLLRQYRLDELPQVVNVLKGEMNVVGPRPEQPEIFARLRERFERYPERQRVLPGITGLAQVTCGYGGSTADVERKLECDLAYRERRSITLDLWILLRTIPVVLLRTGAR
jgi:lipopolysaccharide/colanic/teichoic acid biosynthesis glycosyltransferase